MLGQRQGESLQLLNRGIQAVLVVTDLFLFLWRQYTSERRKIFKSFFFFFAALHETMLDDRVREEASILMLHTAAVN